MAASRGPLNFSTSRFRHTFSLGSVKVYVYESSIVDVMDVDCIVNSVNEELTFTHGVALDIAAEAGRGYTEECKQYISSHGRLGFAEVFTPKACLRKTRLMLAHCGFPGESHQSIEDNLFNTIMNILKEAANQQFNRIAIPGIGTGKQGFSISTCARVYVRAVQEFASSTREGLSGVVQEVHYVDVNAEVLQEIQAAHDELIAGSSPCSTRTSWNRKTSVPELKVFQLSGTLTVKICTQSLDTIDRVDAVVCRIDQTFEGGVVSKQLLALGGKGYQNALYNQRRLTPTVHDGDVLVLTADVKIASHVLLAVFGGQLPQRNPVELDILQSLYHKIIQTSRGNNFQRIAMPLIGLGMQWDFGRIEDVVRRLVEVLNQASSQGGAMLEIMIADKASVVTDSLKQMLGRQT